jgi:hypothetical protein
MNEKREIRVAHARINGRVKSALNDTDKCVVGYLADADGKLHSLKKIT